MEPNITNEKLTKAIQLIKEGKKKEGGQILLEIVKSEPKNENAWLWLSTCYGNEKNKIQCLKKVLEINPSNENARKALNYIEKISEHKEPIKIEENLKNSTNQVQDQESKPTDRYIKRKYRKWIIVICFCLLLLAILIIVLLKLNNDNNSPELVFNSIIETETISFTNTVKVASPTMSPKPPPTNTVLITPTPIPLDQVILTLNEVKQIKNKMWYREGKGFYVNDLPEIVPDLMKIYDNFSVDEHVSRSYEGTLLGEDWMGDSAIYFDIRRLPSENDAKEVIKLLIEEYNNITLEKGLPVNIFEDKISSEFNLSMDSRMIIGIFGLDQGCPITFTVVTRKVNVVVVVEIIVPLLYTDNYDFEDWALIYTAFLLDKL